MSFEFALQGFIVLYLLMLVVIGFIASKRMNNLEDFMLAGRGVGAWVIAFAFSATGMSGWLGLGFAGFVYREGFAASWTMIPSATVGVIVSFVLVGKYIRAFAADVNAITIPDVLEERYEDTSSIIRLISVVILVTASISYVNSQSVAIGKIFSNILGWDYTLTIIFAAVLFISWTMLGGLLAICWTDFIQGILMFTGALMAGGFALSFAGGLDGLSMGAAQINSIDPKFAISPFTSGAAIFYGITLFLSDGLMNWLGAPSLLTRFMATRNTKQVSLSAALAVFIQSVLFGGTFLAALYMRVKFPDTANIPFDSETVLMYFFKTMTHPVFAGLFIGSVLASIISTADSMLLLGASTIINDLYIKVMKKKLDDKTALLYSRIATGALGVFGVGLALSGGSVLWLSWFGWTTMGIFCGPVTLGLWWPRATRKGAIAGLALGFATLVVWTFFGLEGPTNMFMAFPACSMSFLGTWAVSLVTEPVSEQMQNKVRNLKNFAYVEDLEEKTNIVTSA